MTSSNQTANKVQPRGKRLALKWVFTLALSGLFVVFLPLLGLTYYQLIKLNTVSEDISNRDIPQMLQFHRLANRAATLMFATEQLSNAITTPAMRLAQLNIENELELMDTQIQATQLDDAFIKEYQGIELELDELLTLVKQRLDAIQQLADKQQQLFAVYESAQIHLKNTLQSRQSDVSEWAQGYSSMFVLASSIASARTLNEIRQKTLQLNNDYTALDNASAGLGQNYRPQANQLASAFSGVVFGEQGLIELAVNQLRIKGRAHGRGNFTGELVADFARSLQFQGSLVNDRILVDADKTNRNITRQIQLTGFFIVLAIIITLAISWILRRHIIDRLILLNNLVSNRTLQKTTYSQLSGHDEITDIAATFDHYFNTIEKQQQELSKQALQDGLTGIANRRSFDQMLNQEFFNALRYRHPLSVLLIDVDYFKQFNDVYGHIKGDNALIDIAQALQSTLRRHVDLVARYGGEEFACILPNTDASGAQVYAEDVRKCVELLRIEHTKNVPRPIVTISVGGVCFDSFDIDGQSVEAILKAADEALYKAKHAGRNQVQFIKV